MGDRELSGNALAFLQDHVDSVVTLEALLLLRAAAPDRDWTDACVAGELRVTPSWVSGMLASLHERSILARSAAPPYAYRLANRTGSSWDALTELAQAYAQRRVMIINLIFAKPSDPVRSFADAFRLRPDPKSRPIRPEDGR